MTEVQELLPLTTEARLRLAGAPCVVMLDVDGTLAPIVDRPENAAVPAATRSAVAALVERPSVHVALVSGRAAADAYRMVGVRDVWVVGNHGAEWVSPTGQATVDPQVAPFEASVARARRTLSELLMGVQGVHVEDKRFTLSVHYRLADQALVPRLRGMVERVAIEEGLRVHHGKMVFEVRPPVQVDKGTAVLALAGRLGAFGSDSSLVFIGDDRTDEDAFRALRGRSARALTVLVAGSRVGTADSTAAEFTLPDPEAVRRFLDELVELRTAGT